MEQYYNEEYLSHYGVKGMKWGVRRTPEQLGRKTGNRKALGYERAKIAATNYVKNNYSGKKLEEAIEHEYGFNKAYDDYYNGNPKAGTQEQRKRKYLEFANSDAEKRRIELKTDFIKGNASSELGSLIKKMNGIGFNLEQQLSGDLKNEYDELYFTFDEAYTDRVVVPAINRLNKDTGSNLLSGVDYDVQHSDLSDNELCHWGIKGQKWGVRRYQYKDGSLTPAGAKRYNKDMEKLKKEEAKLKAEQKKLADKKKSQARFDKIDAKKASIEAQRKALEEEKKSLKGSKKPKESNKPEETLEEHKARLMKSADAKELYKNRDILTNEEINDRINRIDIEAKLKSRIIEEKKKTGLERIQKGIEYYKKVDEVVTTVSKSTIGKSLAKKLGIELEPKKKDFNLKEFVKNMNKHSHEEIEKVSKRVKNEQTIQDELRRRENKKKADEEHTKDDKPDNNKPKNDKTDKEKKTNESKTETYTGEVEGEGTSKSKFNNDNNRSNDSKPDDYYDPIDAYYTEQTSTLPSTHVRRGESWIDDLLGR